MTQLAQLKAQAVALDLQIAAAKKAEHSTALATIRELMASHGIQISELASVKRPTAGKVAPKYRDAASGATWTGRGKEPLWIRDRDRATFAI